MANIARRSALQVHGAKLLLTQCALLLLAACSSDEGAAETAAPTADIPDPCALVTGADAEQALGAPISESDRPREANNEYLATCRYVAPRGAGVAVMTIMVHGPESGRAGFRSLREQPFDIEDVAGVGDEAFRIADTLYVLQGEVFFSIGGDLAPEQAKALAMKAIGRLP
ncbi:MAG: hypothetical protein ACREQ8_16225 [Woeseiaceae bacterium]